MLAFWLGNAVTFFHKGITHPVCHGSIQLLDATISLQSDYLYVGDAETATHLLTSSILPENGLFLITSGTPTFPEDFKLPSNLSLIATDLSLVPLYNLVQHYI